MDTPIGKMTQVKQQKNAIQKTKGADDLNKENGSEKAERWTNPVDTWKLALTVAVIDGRGG